MDLEPLIGKFMASEQGQQAMAALQQKGIPADAAQSYLGHSLDAVQAHVNDHADSQGILGDHPGKSFFAAFASGMLKGDGVMGSLEDGAAGVVSGRVVEALCSKAGLDSSTATMVAGAVTPYAMSFIKSHLGGR
jgi:hypothetical protein